MPNQKFGPDEVVAISKYPCEDIVEERIDEGVTINYGKSAK